MYHKLESHSSKNLLVKELDEEANDPTYDDSYCNKEVLQGDGHIMLVI